ncbi:sensor histidine kinase [uncultured Ruthenibacterium sp.]|uniref:sensor histidine kinase n=1 Tax=uncultured Ruthenibacterium sp. TaxID=1905347 RepID=UPI00349EB1DC
MRRLTIRLKVTLWFTLFMALLAGLALWLLFSAGGESARLATRDRMVSLVEESRAAMVAVNGSLEISNELEYFDDGVYLSVYTSAGEPLYGAVPGQFDNTSAFSDRRMRAVGTGQTNWYVYDARHEIDGYGAVWVRGVASADDVNSTLRAMLQLALVVFPFFVVSAAVGGYFIARRAFRPVRRIAQTAQEISAGNDLSRRIALGEGRDEIYALAAEFDHMFERLQAAFEAEKQFASDASHELRTPTSIILSQCEDALENADTLDQARSALSAVLDQAEKMAALISQLLLLARTTGSRQRLNLERVDLSELTTVVAEQMEETARVRNISIETEIQPDLVVQGDETMLMRLLMNLMENGIKYGRQDGWLRVTLSGNEQWVTGTIEDNGIGIAPEHLDKVWNRFWQADPARSTQGAGLGLSMVKWIAEAHGGSVQVQSTLGKGTSFTFTLSRVL